MPRPDNPIALNLARIVHRLISNPRGWRVHDLMEDLGIKGRTYRKYRKLLQEHFEHTLFSGAEGVIDEVVVGDDRYLRFIQGSDTIENKKDFLSRVAALYMARSVFGFLKSTDLKDVLDDFYSELQTRVTDKPYILGHFLKNMDRMLYYIPDAPKDYTDQGDKIDKLLRALFYRRRTRITHQSPEGKRSVHEIEPLTLILYKNGFYLVAQYPESKARYTFAVDRITQVEKLKERFDYPGDYSPESYTEGCFGLFRGREKKRILFELAFKDDKWLHTYLKERRWHPTQKFKSIRDGRLKMSFTVRSDVEVWPWVRSFGEDVEVLKPKTS